MCQRCNTRALEQTQYCGNCGEKDSLQLGGSPVEGSLLFPGLIGTISPGLNVNPEKASLIEGMSASILGMSTLSAGVDTFVDLSKISGIDPQSIDPILMEQNAIRADLRELKREFGEASAKTTAQVKSMKEEIEARLTDHTKRIIQILIIPDRLVKNFNACNLLFSTIVDKGVLFNVNPELLPELLTPCETEKDFAYKIGSLSTIFEVYLAALRHVVGNPPPQAKSLTLSEDFLFKNGKSAKATIEPFKMVNRLRNASAPFHLSKPDLVEACRFFGEQFPPDYPALWVKVLEKLLASLEQLANDLSSMTRVNT